MRYLIKSRKWKVAGVKSNGLFGPGPNWDLNACVGYNGGPADYHRQGDGFFAAGTRLLASVSDDTFGIDRLIYPLVTLYRQGIELYLKHFCTEIPPLLEKAVQVKLNHRLEELWPVARELLAEIVDNEESFREHAEWVDTIIRDFVEVDPDGTVFRYPTDKQGVPHLQDMSLINAEVLGEQMAALHQVFETWDCLMCAVSDMRSEYLAEMRSNMEYEYD